MSPKQLPIDPIDYTWGVSKDIDGFWVQQGPYDDAPAFGDIYKSEVSAQKIARFLNDIQFKYPKEAR